jgi:hypothetical protein
VRAESLCGDDDGDIALLELADRLPRDFEPLLWVTATSAMDGDRFVAEGFGAERPPGSTPHAVDGHIVRADTRLFNRSPALQLNSPQLRAGESAHQSSGGPVLVRGASPHGASTGLAVAVIRWQRARPDAPTQASGGDFYATPIAHALACWPKFAAMLSSRRAVPHSAM